VLFGHQDTWFKVKFVIYRPYCHWFLYNLKKMLFKKPLINHFYHKVSILTSSTALFKDIKIRKRQRRINE